MMLADAKMVATIGCTPLGYTLHAEVLSMPNSCHAFSLAIRQKKRPKRSVYLSSDIDYMLFYLSPTICGVIYSRCQGA